jgi:hypothetical protein
MEYKRRGEKLSYPQGLNDVLAIIIAEAPPAETRTRLDYRRAHQYLTDEGIADSTENGGAMHEAREETSESRC